nr:MAG TPA: Putative stress-responsive nuclear envelope protein [Caudoviricetes sp.]
MATKLNPATAKKVKALGINAKSEEDAREKLLEILKDNGIDGMEEEDTETLIDIAESFVEEGGETELEEQEAEELANEAEEEETEEEKPKANGKKAPAKDDDDEEEEEETEEPEEEETEEGDEFDEMDRTELKAYIKKNGLEITVKKSMTDDDIRDLIREVNDEEEETEEETEDEVPVPKAKAAKKAETKAPEKPAKKKEEKKETKSKPAGKRGTKLDPKNNEDDRKAFAPLKKLFPEDEFNYAWVASAGVTIKHKGTNSNRSMVLIENCSQMPDGSIKCNLYLLTFNKQLEVLDEAGIEYEKRWSGAPLIKGITLDEAIEIIKGLLDNILSSVKKIDKKLGENRKKMEENLNKKAPKKAAKPAKDDDDEEEEEETEEPEEEETEEGCSNKENYK